MLFSEVPEGSAEHPWPGRICRGVTAWIGDGGIGKGICWADVAARVSRGWPFPPTMPDDPLIDWGQMPGPGFVITIALEDTADDVRQRLVAAGGDLSMVDDLSHVERVDGNGLTTRFKINTDLPELSKRVTELTEKGRGPVRLIIIDPVMSAASTTLAFNQQLRANIIEPLQEWSKQTGIDVLLIGHFTKAPGRTSLGATKGNLVDQVGGSAGFTQALRLTCAVLADPLRPEVRRLVGLKANGGMADDAVEYRIVANGPNDPDAHVEYLLPPIAVTDDAGWDQVVARCQQVLADAGRALTLQELAVFTRLSYDVVRYAMIRARKAGIVQRSRGAFTAVPAIEAAPQLTVVSARSYTKVR